MGLYEIQVLDSYQSKTYPDGQVGAVYGQYPPLVNAARKPGDPSPFIDRGTYIRYMMISMECIEAQEGWVRAGKPQTSSRN